MTKKLYRSRQDQMLGGVCGGIADYFEVDSTLVRLIAVVLAVFGGATIVAYLIAWVIIPEEPKGEASELEASLIETESRKEEQTKNLPRKTNMELLGWLFILLGALWISTQIFSWWPLSAWIGRLLAPVGLIVIGVFVLLNNRRKRK